LLTSPRVLGSTTTVQFTPAEKPLDAVGRVYWH
jgi:hypothetical protein